MRSDSRLIIAASKAITDTGKWGTGRMPRTAFPLSRSGAKAYRLGNRRWRVVTFSAAGAECRLLISYSFALFEYQAMLGVMIGDDTKVVATLEHHANHNPPWHAHLCCDPLSEIPVGIKRGPWNKRFCGTAKRYRERFPNTDGSAFNMAARFFKLGARSGQGLDAL